MNYLSTSFSFKVKKIFRYIRLFGINRTIVKIQAQLHMNRNHTTGEKINNIINKNNISGNVAIVGCGNFSFSTIGYYVKKNNSQCIKYSFDIDQSKSLSFAKKYSIYKTVSKFEEILDDPGIELIYIASNHASHAEYAIQAIDRNKNVHIEKPQVVNENQLKGLIKAMKANPNSKVFLGYNRPKSLIFQKLTEKLNQQQGSIMVNWFVAGHEIDDDHWYFSEREGGRVLGNLCHWSDLTLHLVGINNAFPCKISPSVSQNDKSNFSLVITFANGSQAGITFSAKGHTFEGVREYLNVHKGDLLASLQDFEKLTIDVINKKYKHKMFTRDHGHKSNILNSYFCTNSDAHGESIEYIFSTSILILKIKEALSTKNITYCNNNVDEFLSKVDIYEKAL